MKIFVSGKTTKLSQALFDDVKPNIVELENSDVQLILFSEDYLELIKSNEFHEYENIKNTGKHIVIISESNPLNKLIPEDLQYEVIYNIRGKNKREELTLKLKQEEWEEVQISKKRTEKIKNQKNQQKRQNNLAKQKKIVEDTKKQEKNELEDSINIMKVELEKQKEELLKKEIDLQNIKSEKTEINICVICADSAIDSVFIPCGHSCCCLDCAKDINNSTNICPICRANVEQTIKLYSVSY